MITKLHDGNRGGGRIVAGLKRSFETTEFKRFMAAIGFSRLGLGPARCKLCNCVSFRKLYIVSYVESNII